MLRKRFGVESKIHSYKKRGKILYYLSMNSKNAKKFKELTAPFVLPFFSYKNEFRTKSEWGSFSAVNKGLVPVTSIKKIQPKYKEPRMGFLYDLEVEDNHNFVVGYGKEGIVAHNCHYLAGEVYSRTVNRFNARYRRGVTATPIRKDGLDVIIKGVVGPIIHEVEPSLVQQAPMEVERINTGVKIKGGSYATLLTKLSQIEIRNKRIVEKMVEDVMQGRTIVAVTDRKEHQTLIKNLLKTHDIPCELFNGTTNDRKQRKSILNRIRNREVPVLIAMRNMTTGLDIPRADTFYNLLPSANAVKDGIHEGEGGYEQQCTRVRTPFEGKTKCWVRDFVDDFGFAYACWQSRVKTYKKIGAYILKTKEESVPEFNKLSAMDDSGWNG